MSPQMSDYKWEEPCFPRVSGDEPFIRRAVDILQKFSPRERG